MQIVSQLRFDTSLNKFYTTGIFTNVDKSVIIGMKLRANAQSERSGTQMRNMTVKLYKHEFLCSLEEKLYFALHCPEKCVKET